MTTRQLSRGRPNAPLAASEDLCNKRHERARQSSPRWIPRYAIIGRSENPCRCFIFVATIVSARVSFLNKSDLKVSESQGLGSGVEGSRGRSLKVVGSRPFGPTRLWTLATLRPCDLLEPRDPSATLRPFNLPTLRSSSRNQ